MSAIKVPVSLGYLLGREGSIRFSSFFFFFLACIYLYTFCSCDCVLYFKLFNLAQYRCIFPFLRLRKMDLWIKRSIRFFFVTIYDMIQRSLQAEHNVLFCIRCRKW